MNAKKQESMEIKTSTLSIFIICGKNLFHTSIPLKKDQPLFLKLGRLGENF